ncbi:MULTISPECIES: YeeE/YedE thiosulfate transporter family protein [unclassified Sphingomonas]|uniref:YeeE/YedE thiosulfate transporter family protein n=1 Tax=unclassified Sphingomonas TaxID=196159 RepID=UPI00082BEEEE|nr:MULTISPECIES: YeeE/YedE thiosulfate transporter family protein [unclassified Sphingomonas]
MNGASPVILALSAASGLAFGYAARRGSICIVRGIEGVFDGRSPRLFLSFFRCSLWVIAISVPILWLDPDAHLSAIYFPTLTAALAGMAFGAGAAINGGCSFGTIIRLGAGDFSYLATLLGMLGGFQAAAFTHGVVSAPRPMGRSLLETMGTTAVIVLVIAWVFVVHELVRGRTRRGDGGDWSPEGAAAVMGVTGGLLYALHGSWAYTIVLQRGAETMRAGGIADFDLLLISLASVGGAMFAAWRTDAFVPRLNGRELPQRLVGGFVMGIGTAWIPGGNDALVLHGFPGLSPHAPVAYLALIAGASLMLALPRWIERRMAAMR